METLKGNLQVKLRLDWKFVFLAGLLAVCLYLSGFLLFLMPLPFLFAFKKGGLTRGLVALTVALFILIVLYAGLIPWVATIWGEQKALDLFFWVPGLIPPLSPFNWGLLIGNLAPFFYFALIGSLLGFFEAKPYSITRLIGQIELVLLLLIAALILVYSQGDLIGMIKGLEKGLSELLREAARLSSANNQELKSQFALFEEKSELIAYYLVRLLPGWLISLGIFVQWLNIVVSRKIFLKEIFFFQLGALRRWQLPFVTIWITIATIAAWLLNAQFLHTQWVAILAYNIFIVLVLLYFFQGVSIAVFYSVRWGLAPLTRFLFYFLLILFFYPLGVILVSLGFFDAWFDFRKLHSKDAAPPEPNR